MSQLSSLFQEFAFIGLNFTLKLHFYCYNTVTHLYEEVNRREQSFSKLKERLLFPADICETAASFLAVVLRQINEQVFIIIEL